MTYEFDGEEFEYEPEITNKVKKNILNKFSKEDLIGFIIEDIDFQDYFEEDIKDYFEEKAYREYLDAKAVAQTYDEINDIYRNF